MMEPATRGAEIPMVTPMPINATPMVPAVVQEDPVAMATIAHNIHDATRKICGLRIFSP